MKEKSDECDCLCHSNPGMQHIVMCCSRCKSCKKRIRREQYEQHIEKCGVIKNKGK